MWTEEQALRCPGCGLPKDETWPTDGALAIAMADRYEGEPVKCVACASAHRAQKKFAQMPHDDEGIHWMIRDRKHEEY